jgi:hypothetical protein
MAKTLLRKGNSYSFREWLLDISLLLMNEGRIC